MSRHHQQADVDAALQCELRTSKSALLNGDHTDWSARMQRASLHIDRNRERTSATPRM